MRGFKITLIALTFGVILGFLISQIFEKVFFNVGNSQFISEEEVITKRGELGKYIDSAQIFKRVTETIVPSVVSIKTNIYVSLFESDILGYKTDSSGSGFVLDKEGHIVTNYHVVKGARKISVVLYNGEEYAAKFVGADKLLDIAILKINADKKFLIPVILGNSDDVSVGDFVIAVGCPMGWLEHSVTMGIISAKGRRTVNISSYEGFLQTDAAINPGNSGGPLVDLNGKVIGINTAIISPQAGYQGISFAIPINTLKDIKDTLTQKGTVARGFLGVNMANIDEALAYKYNFDSLQDFLNFLGLSSSKGVFIAEVVRNSPAHKAGLREGDVIVKFNDTAIDNKLTLYSYIIRTKPGTEVHLKIIRDKKEKTITVKIGERESE